MLVRGITYTHRILMLSVWTLRYPLSSSISCRSAASPPSISASSGASVAGIGSRDCESLEPDQRERLREAMMAVFAERSG